MKKIRIFPKKACGHRVLPVSMANPTRERQGSEMNKRRLLALTLALCLLGGCALPGVSSGPQQHQVTYLTLFDTVTTILGYGESQKTFRLQAQSIHDALLEYHQLFDIYNDYEGIHNLKTINDQAGIAPVAVDSRILRLLEDCKTWYALTEGRVNVAMGSVLSLWHQARTQGTEDPQAATLPDRAALEEASRHCSMDTVILDHEAGTVFLSDPGQRLDVGAVAKGWAVQQVCSQAPEGLLVSVGGNVCATGPKPADAPWVVGVQHPREAQGVYLHTLNLSRGSVVSSGDYQRYYEVDGVSYHHIIDPETLEPARLWQAVTVICPDSGLSDCLSTALFLMDQQEGQALLEQTHAEAMWVDPQGNVHYSPGFAPYIHQ